MVIVGGLIFNPLRTEEYTLQTKMATAHHE